MNIVLALNVSEEQEGDLMTVEGVMHEAGLDTTAAFHLSDLAVFVSRGAQAAVVDLSFPGVHDQVARIVATAPGPLRLASVRFWRDCPSEKPDWAERHLVYSSAQQFAEVVRDFLRA